MTHSRSRRQRRADKAVITLRYILGIVVLAIVFTISHLLLWKPNDVAPGEDQAVLDAQEDAYYD
ncbi:MAG: hypothetical protein AB7U35_12230 [Sphingobium sp.]